MNIDNQNMKYKHIFNQNEEFVNIIKQNKDLITILDYIDKLQLPNFYIAAGAVFQTIWNYYDNKPLNYNIKDIDIIYFDPLTLSKEDEKIIENKIRDYFKSKNMNYIFDVHNQARMHLWKKEKENVDIEQYQNSEDAINKWIATLHAVGISKEGNDIKVYAPYGLSDIFSKTVRPIKHSGNSKDLYYKKVYNWQKRFNNLTIIEW